MFAGLDRTLLRCRSEALTSADVPPLVAALWILPSGAVSFRKHSALLDLSSAVQRGKHLQSELELTNEASRGTRAGPAEEADHVRDAAPHTYPHLVDCAVAMTSSRDPEFHYQLGVSLFIVGLGAIAAKGN